MIDVSGNSAEREISFSETPADFLVVAVEVAKMLRWIVADLRETGFVMQLPEARLALSITGNIATVKVLEDATQEGKAEEELLLFLSKIWDLRYYFTKEELALKYLQLEPLFIRENEAPPQPEPVGPKITGTLGSIKDYLVTASMVAANVLIFFTMVAQGMDVLEPASGIMIAWGANYGLYTLQGEWWRMLSSCFLHFGIVHLLANMYALMYVGFLLEPYLGRARFLTAYLLTGLLASLTSLWWHPYTVSAGASGAVFGMYGVLLALLSTSFIAKKIRKPMLLSIGFFVFYNLSSGLKEGIDNAAHLGGLLSGMALGYVYLWSLKKPAATALKYISILLLLAAGIGLTRFAYSRIPNTMAVYQTQMEQFTKNEEKSTDWFQQPRPGTAEEQLEALETYGIELWKENTGIMETLHAINLPRQIEERNQVLYEYSRLRLLRYELMYKAAKEQTTRYDGQIAELDRQMAAQLGLLETKE